jgi:hypothetical protein
MCWPATARFGLLRSIDRHCERSEAIQRGENDGNPERAPAAAWIASSLRSSQ